MTDGYKIKRGLIRVNGVEKQFYPAGWKPGENTILYMPMKSDLLDHSGNNRAVTNNGVTISGGVGIFNGSSYLSLGTDNWTKFQSYSSGTICLWFMRTGDIPSGYNGYIIGKARMHPNTESNALYGIGYNDTYKLVAGVFPGNSWSPTPIPYGSNITVSKNTWYNMVLVKSGTAKTMYINGVSVGSGTAQDSTSTDNPPLTIGSATYSSSNSYVTGNISEVILENKARTSDEISTYYNSTKSNYGL